VTDTATQPESLADALAEETQDQAEVQQSEEPLVEETPAEEAPAAEEAQAAEDAPAAAPTEEHNEVSARKAPPQTRMCGVWNVLCVVRCLVCPGTETTRAAALSGRLCGTFECAQTEVAANLLSPASVRPQARGIRTVSTFHSVPGSFSCALFRRVVCAVLTAHAASLPRRTRATEGPDDPAPRSECTSKAGLSVALPSFRCWADHAFSAAELLALSSCSGRASVYLALIDRHRTRVGEQRERTSAVMHASAPAPPGEPST
jgi:hypothetical protein